MKKVLRYKPYFERSGGGVTCSGGEPLLQPEFLYEFLRSCRDANLHTAVDTAGIGIDLMKAEKVLPMTDLVLLDIKHYSEDGYRDLAGGSLKELMDFIELLNKLQKKVWVRHVVVPGITDDESHMNALYNLIKNINNSILISIS